MKGLGEKLKKAREKKGLGQKEVSQITGINYKTISNYETDRSEPDVENLALLCKAYNVSADYFIDIEKAPDKLSEARKAIPDRLAENYYELDEPNRDQLVKYSDVLVSAYRYGKAQSSAYKDEPVNYTYEMVVRKADGKEYYDIIATAPGHDTVRFEDAFPMLSLAFKLANDLNNNDVKLVDAPQFIADFRGSHIRRKFPDNSYAAMGGGIISMDSDKKE